MDIQKGNFLRRLKLLFNHGIEPLAGKNQLRRQRVLEESILERLYTILVLSSSKEVGILNKLAEEKTEYYDSHIIRELFEESEPSSSGVATMYLKNKYLYITTRGVMNYLRLYEEQNKRVNKNYYEFEVETVKSIIQKRLSENNVARLNIISLGAANSDKECRIFKALSRNSQDVNKIKYIPIDISNYLIHLGIMNISSQKETKCVETQSIISDFWALSEYITCKDKDLGVKNKLFGEGKRLFLLLGGTFGNYTEKELLDVIESFMEAGDELVISLKLKKGKEDTIGKEYEELPGDSEFLLEPLTYIPFFYGYARYKRDLLKRNGEKTILKEEDVQKKYVSVIPNSICYSPYIVVQKPDNCTVDMRLAWSTRYVFTDTKDWFDKYRSKDNDYIFEVESIKDHNADYALFFLTKTLYNYSDELKTLIMREYPDIILSHRIELEQILQSKEKSRKLYKSVNNKEITDYKGMMRFIKSISV